MRFPTSLRHSVASSSRQIPVSARRTNATITQKPFQSSASTSVKYKFPEAVPTITQLSNGLRVVTEPSNHHTATVGVCVDAGSRFESERNLGVTHLLDKLAWQSNSKYSSEEMEIAGQRLGSSMHHMGTRDFFTYCAMTFHSTLPLAVSILASNLIHPLLLPEEIASAKETAIYETELMRRTVREALLPELITQTAYNGNTLGNPLFMYPESAERLGEREVRGYMRDWFKPDRIVVAGLGMPHEELVDMVKENFDFASPPTIQPGASSHSTSPRTAGPSRPQAQGVAMSPGKSYATVSNVQDLPLDSDFDKLATEEAVYTGGEYYEDIPGEKWTHLAIAFEAPHATDPDVYASAVINQMLLGGTSFSQGGPGKGMYSRLNLNVLNRYHWVDLCQSFQEIWLDSGLLGIKIGVSPQFAPRAASVICEQLHSLTGQMIGGVREDQLMRAKNMLKVIMAGSAETKIMAVEDLGRQVLALGYKESLRETWEKVDAVTVEDIHRVATRIFRPDSRQNALNHGLGSGRPTIVGLGPNVEALGDVKSTLRHWDLGSKA